MMKAIFQYPSYTFLTNTIDEAENNIFIMSTTK